MPSCKRLANLGAEEQGHHPTGGLFLEGNPKDLVESKAKSLVCKRRVALAAMQRAIAVNWTTALAAVGHPTGK